MTFINIILMEIQSPPDGWFWYTLCGALVVFMGALIWKIGVFLIGHLSETFKQIAEELKILNNSDIRQNMTLDNHEERLDEIEGKKLVKYQNQKR